MSRKGTCQCVFHADWDFTLTPKTGAGFSKYFVSYLVYFHFKKKEK